MRVPLVDLSIQQREIADEVERGFAEVIDSNAFILGPDVTAFEAAFARFCEVSHCVGVASGTDALELSIRALGLGHGDKIMVPANSFIASALSALRAGVEVVLADVDPRTHLLSATTVERVMGPEIRAIMPVHLYGQIAPVETIRSVGGNALIIEDAAQSQGATRHGSPAGSIGLIAGTSFYPGKNIGAYGDAGAVLTDDPALADRVRKLRNWGSAEKYHHPEIGFNSRLDTLQAVVLSAKLKRLQRWNEQRGLAAQRYRELLSDIDQVELPTVLEGNTHVWHLFVIKVPNRDEVLRHLHSAGVEAGIHYPTPIHLQPALSDLGHRPGDFPATEKAAAQVLSLPIFPGITERQQEYVNDSLRRALRSRI